MQIDLDRHNDNTDKVSVFINPRATNGGGGWLPPLYVFCFTNLFHMEYNFDILGSCRRFTCAQFEVKTSWWYPTPLKSYTRYSRGTRGVDTKPLSFSTTAYSLLLLEEKQMCHSLEGMHAGLHLLAYLFVF